jgi:hypothetical protein
LVWLLRLSPANKSTSSMSALPAKADIAEQRVDVRFSNRPIGVKHFQAFHDGGFNVARGLVLLYGIGT